MIGTRGPSIGMAKWLGMPWVWQDNHGKVYNGCDKIGMANYTKGVVWQEWQYMA